MQVRTSIPLAQLLMTTALSALGKSILGGLIKPPVVRQFLHNDQLYKEEEDRGISSFELFADLVFVAIVHVSIQVTESPDSNVFCP